MPAELPCSVFAKRNMAASVDPVNGQKLESNAPSGLSPPAQRRCCAMCAKPKDGADFQAKAGVEMRTCNVCRVSRIHPAWTVDMRYAHTQLQANHNRRRVAQRLVRRQQKHLEAQKESKTANATAATPRLVVKPQSLNKSGGSQHRLNPHKDYHATAMESRNVASPMTSPIKSSRKAQSASKIKINPNNEVASQSPEQQ